MRTAICFALLASACSPRAAGESAAETAWQALFAEDAPAAAKAKIDAVLAACGSDVAKLKALIASDTAYAKMKPAWHRRKTKVQDGEKTYEAEFIVRVPTGYTPARPWPVLLVAHGQGNDGGHILAAFDRVLGKASDRFLVVAPTLPGPQGFNARPYQVQTYLNALAWTRTHLNVDDDRVYLSGYSQGGHLVWHVATMYPYHFAAAVPMAGAPIFEGFPATALSYLHNLSNLAVWAIWGENDRPGPPKIGNADICRSATQRLKALRVRTYKATELKGKGHAGCWPTGQELSRFLLAHKRTAAPRRYWHYFHLAYHKRSYYVEATAFAHPPFDFVKGTTIHLPPGVEPTQENIKRAFEKKVAQAIFRIYAQIDPQTNTLRIQPLGLRKVRLYVLDGLFDLDKPVRLNYFARAWRGRIRPSAKCILTHYAATRDATALVLNEVDLSSAGRVAIRYKQ